MEQVKFTIRIYKDDLKKFKYIAEYNARSANQELNKLIRRYIKKFELKNGRIFIE